MELDLFAGVSVTDHDRAMAWFEQLLGAPPSFLPNDIEAVWEVAPHRYLFTEVLANHANHAGHARHTLFVDDLDSWVDAAAGRGLEPAHQETYDNGVRKVTYRDPDGNEISFGGGA